MLSLEHSRMVGGAHPAATMVSAAHFPVSYSPRDQAKFSFFREPLPTPASDPFSDTSQTSARQAGCHRRLANVYPPASVLVLTRVLGFSLPSKVWCSSGGAGCRRPGAGLAVGEAGAPSARPL